MAATGAKGATREELARVLGADKIFPEDWRSCYANLLEALRLGAQDQQLTLANSAWITSEYHLSPDFEQAVTHSLGGEAKSLAGASPAAQINSHPRLLLPLRWSLIDHFCAWSQTS